MDYLSTLKSFFASNARQRLYTAIPTRHVAPAFEDDPFEADHAYLRIWITDMYLKHRRVLGQTRFPIVQTACRFLYDGNCEEVNLIAGPNQISGLGQATDRMINQNYPIFGPVPFTGGDVELLMALNHVQVADFSQELIDVLGTVSQLAARGEVQVALKFLAPIKQILDGAFGTQKVLPHLVMHNTFNAAENAPNRLRSGYWLVMDVTGGKVTASNLWVKEGRLHQGENLKTAVPFEGADYFVFYIQKVGQRDEFQTIPAVWKAWKATLDAAKRSSEEELDLAFETFRGTVLGSPDFILLDQSRLILELAAKVKAVQAMKARRHFAPLKTDIDDVLAAGARSEEAARATRSDLLGVSWRS